MIRQAFISNGVAYHHGIVQPGQPLADFEVVDLGRLADVDLNAYDLIVVPRSADGESLRARRYQFARFLDNGGVLIALGELWADWFPGCRWEQECREDVLAPVITSDHPLVAGYTPQDLHWHPALERWCCHGHLVAPPDAEVLVRNSAGDAWLYVDRTTTNGVIVASTNLDPDTHTFHGSAVARSFFDQLVAWAREEAAETPRRRERQPKKLAGLYSGVHFQRAFYADHEFAPEFAVLPVWELSAADLHDYAALWIPRESNQHELVQNRAKLRDYLNDGGTVICFDEVNQPWLPVGSWSLERAAMENVRVAAHPMVAHLSPEQVNWHAHGAYEDYPNAEILVDDGDGHVLLFLDDRSFGGNLLAGTMDPDCHVGFGTEKTRPLLRAILTWVRNLQQAPVGAF
ncbi:MAG: hypothetical protein H0V86_12330 [Chloroflexia bacterium]|nr:hypothetical protein [Chloroflexia bacterium]